MSKITDSTQFGRRTLQYALIRKTGAKSITITVRPDGRLEVVAARGTRRTAAAEAVKGRGAWILQQLDRLASYQKPQARHFVSGESYQYLGRQYRLKVRPLQQTKRAALRLGRGRLDVQVPARWGRRQRRDGVRGALVTWYRQRAAEKIPAVVDRLARKLGVAAPVVRVYELKGRWASCGKGGVLRFNWRIILAPMSLVEYVVAHEVCHLKHTNHTPRFWKALAALLPDFDRRAERLNAHGPRYDL